MKYAVQTYKGKTLQVLSELLGPYDTQQEAITLSRKIEGSRVVPMVRRNPYE